ncbi:MAG TPA: aminotransferase class V-fold PLP-dependent enzyme [Phycisphaerales bacterium]|nr:aminotransferase class V-fold PLP-dependent enzyme [Phycisphaerales bacterium]
MPSRREFLGAMYAPAAACTAASVGLPMPRCGAGALLAELGATPGTPEEIARDEDFWRFAQQAFTVDRSMVNLNNGGVSPSPRWVQEAMKDHLDLANKSPAYYLWQVQEPRKEVARTRLAGAWGVDPEEIAITRNASESLQICQLGLGLAPGDEVLCCTQDYPRMITTFQQRARRDGIVLRQVKIPSPAEDTAKILAIYRDSITERTRLLLVSHVINITGQVMPVREIVALARERGVPTVVDGAHSFAHLDFKLPDLGCDYFGTSLHKWLFAPHGTGMLYVRRDRIPGLWPMMAAAQTQDADIRKFEEIGTHPAANHLAIAEALTFHESLGAARKQARMIYLRERWMERLYASGRARLHTSRKPGCAAGIGTVQLEGLDTAELGAWLWEKHRILVVAIKHAEFEGLRISPSVYSTLEEVDRFCGAVEAALRDGIG